MHGEELLFESDGYKLSGTLYVPVSEKPVAAVVIPQQAGTELRTHPLYQQKVRVFNTLGFAAFVYDRRGAGESEGPQERPSYEALKRDSVAAKKAIAGHSRISENRIGFWGLSQSGWIAMMAANASNAAFAIVVSSPLTTPEEQMDILTYNYVRSAYGEEAAQRALQVRQTVMTDYFEGNVSYSEVQSQIRSIEDKPWFEFVYIPRAEDFPEDISKSTWVKERVRITLFIRKNRSILTN